MNELIRLMDYGAAGSTILTVVIFIWFLLKQQKRFDDIADGLRSVISECADQTKENNQFLGANRQLLSEVKDRLDANLGGTGVFKVRKQQ